MLLVFQKKNKNNYINNKNNCQNGVGELLPRVLPVGTSTQQLYGAYV